MIVRLLEWDWVMVGVEGCLCDETFRVGEYKKVKDGIKIDALNCENFLIKSDRSSFETLCVRNSLKNTYRTLIYLPIFYGKVKVYVKNCQDLKIRLSKHFF